MSEFSYNKLLLFARFFLLIFSYFLFVSLITALINLGLGYKDSLFGIKGVVPIFTAFFIPSLLLAIFSAFFGRVTIEVNDDGIVIKKPLKSESVSFQEFKISAHTVITRYNMVKVNTTRFISLQKYNSKLKKTRISCLDYSQKYFSIMMATIQTKQKLYWNKVNGVIAIDESTNPPVLIKKYDIPYKKINKAGFRSKHLKISLIFLLLFQYLSFEAYQTYADALVGYKPFVFVIVALTFEGLSLIICVPKIIKWFATKKKVRNETPKFVEIYNNKIVIDENTYFFKDIDMIIASPPSYLESYFTEDRYIKIFLRSNYDNSITYRFGINSRNNVAKNGFFENYEEICAFLENSFLQSGKLVYDL